MSYFCHKIDYYKLNLFILLSIYTSVSQPFSLTAHLKFIFFQRPLLAILTKYTTYNKFRAHISYLVYVSIIIVYGGQNSFKAILGNFDVPEISDHEQVLPHLVQILLTLNVDRLISRLAIYFAV